MLAGMDVDQPHNQAVRTAFNITGFPTIMYFDKGSLKYKYGGENNKDGIVSWMRDPSPPKVYCSCDNSWMVLFIIIVIMISGSPCNSRTHQEEGSAEPEWAEEPSEVAHLTDTTFDPYIASHNSTLVMFYAPWCV